MKKALSLLLVVALLAPSPALAATWFVKAAGASTTGPADSCENTAASPHVQNAINAASPGDIVQMASGSCTWTQKLTLALSLIVKGAGQGVTNITINVAAASWPAIDWTLAAGTYARLTALTLLPLITSNSNSFLSFVGTATSGAPAGPRVRVDHVTFGPGWTGNNPLVKTNNVALLVDHTIYDAQSGEWWDHNYPAWAGVGIIGHNSWAAAATYGTTDQGVFEDNTVKHASTNGTQVIEGVAGGGRLTARFNEMDCSAVGGHGAGTSNKRGFRHREIYNNEFKQTAGCTATQNTTQVRGATALHFNNAITSGTWTNYVRLWTERAQDAGNGVGTWASTSNGPGNCGSIAGGADGKNCWDDNDTTGGPLSDGVYESGTLTTGSGTDNAIDSTKSWTPNQWANGHYVFVDVTANRASAILSNTATTITTMTVSNGSAHTYASGDSYKIRKVNFAVDEAGRGQSSLFSGAASAPVASVGIDNALEPVSVWGNTGTATNYVASAPAGWSINGRDYLTDQGAAYDCQMTPGTTKATIKVGTAAQRDTFSGCTTGALFWVTNEGNWRAGFAGTSGKLYRWNGSAWAAWYGPNNSTGEPLAYPHPWLTCGELTDTACAPPADAANSTTSASPGSVVANGVSTSTITVTIKDSTSTVIAGKTVALSCTGSPVVTGLSVVTDGSGQATFSVKDSTIQSVTCTASVPEDAVTVTQTAGITFTGVSAVTIMGPGATFGGGVTVK
jgi:Bacterial Ig-like domain (group 1).